MASGKTTCRPTSNCYTAPAPAPVATQAPNPTPIQPDAKFLGGYNWNQDVFAPYVDITKSPLYDAVALSNAVGSARYILGFVTGDSTGNAVWGAQSTGKLLYNDKITALRAFGGDVGISFGGPGGKTCRII